MEPEEVKLLIENGIPGAKIEVVDTTGKKERYKGYADVWIFKSSSTNSKPLWSGI